jgi:hypothetical protein
MHRVLTAFVAPAFSQEAAPTSRLSGTALPAKGAHPAEGDLQTNFGKLLNNVAKDMGLNGNGAPAEVVLWVGEGYREGRTGFMRSAFGASLSAAGYKVEEVNREQIATNPFSEEYGLGTIDDKPGLLSPWDKFSYFKAVNAARGVQLLGMWVDKPEEKQLWLALASAQFKAPPQSVPLPAAGGPNAIVAKDVNDAMRGIAPQRVTFPKMLPEKGIVKGAVRDGNGKPLAGASIVAWASAAGGFRTSYTTKTDANGMYRLQLPVGICQIVNADVAVRYNGRRYLLPLDAADGERDDFPSNQGHIENFVLRTYGVADEGGAGNNPEYGSNYYGGSIRLVWFEQDIPRGGTFQITLTPKGALMNGVPARTVILRLPNNGRGEAYLNDIPLGDYSLKIELLDGGDSLPVRVKPVFGEGELGPEMDIVFKSKSGNLASLNSCGVERVDVMMKP